MTSLNALMSQKIAETNYAFWLAGVYGPSTRMKIAGKKLSPLQEGLGGTNLVFLVQNTRNNESAKHLRNQYGADYVVVIADFGNLACGYNLENTGSENAYLGVDIGCLGGYTFSHEVGHELGANHASDPGSAEEPYVRAVLDAYNVGVHRYEYRTLVSSLYFDVGPYAQGGSCQCGCPIKPFYSTAGTQGLFGATVSPCNSSFPFRNADIGNSHTNDVARIVRENALERANYRVGTGEGGFPDSKLIDLEYEPDHQILRSALAKERPNGSTQINIYPNPVKEIANVRFYANNSGIASLEVFDMTGRKMGIENVLEVNEGPQFTVLDVGHLPKGNYILKLSTKSGISTSKLVLTQ